MHSSWSKFGTVTNGVVTITGRVVRATIVCPDPSDGKEYSIMTHLGRPVERAFPDTRLEGYESVLGPSVRRAQGEAEPLPFEAPVACLQMVRGDGGELTYGLILTPSESRSGVYKRIGCCWSLDGDWFRGGNSETIDLI